MKNETNFQIDVYTALPCLRYLYCLNERYDYEPEFGLGWETFRRFSSIESTVEHVGLTFQSSPSEEGSGFDLFFGRQLRDPDLEWGDAIFGMSFFFDSGDESGELELWSSDYLDEDRFFAAVEGSDHFRIASSNAPMVASFEFMHPGETL